MLQRIICAGIHRSLSLLLDSPLSHDLEKDIREGINSRSNLLANQLTRQLSQQKAHSKHRLPQIIIIRIQPQIIQKVVRVRLADITPVQIERKESNTRPRCDLPVDSLDEGNLLGPGPSEGRIKAVAVLVVLRGLKVGR